MFSKRINVLKTLIPIFGAESGEMSALPDAAIVQ